MASCIYCNTKVGFLRSSHEACQVKAAQGYNFIGELAQSVFRDFHSAEAPIKAFDRIIKEYCFPPLEAVPRILAQLDVALAEASKSVLFSPTQFQEAGKMLEHFGFDPLRSTSDVGRHGTFSSFLSMLLWYIEAKEEPPYYGDSDGAVQFRLEQGEYPIMSFGGMFLSEDKTASPRHYYGVSLPLAGGVRVNLGSSHSPPSIGWEPVDQGDLMIASKAIYFGGAHRTFRVPYSSILRLDQHLDGIGVSQNNGHPMVFVSNRSDADHGWFAIRR